MMQTSTSFHASLPKSLPVSIPGLRYRIAKIFSTIANPICLAISILITIAAQSGIQFNWFWAGFQLLSSILLPAGFIIYLLVKKKIGDFDIYQRSQRLYPYIFTFTCNAASLLLMIILKAPVLFILIGSAAITQISLMSIINLKWKISAHAAGMAAFTTCLFYFSGGSLLLMLVGIPMMIWSWVYLKRHTFGQVLAGSALGILVFASFLSQIY
jgi:membrane-associated phospholipid phosphatase